MKIIFLLISKYLISALIAIYAFSCFNIFRLKTEADRKRAYISQNVCMILIYTLSFLSLYFIEMDVKYLAFYAISLFTISLFILLTGLIYKRANRLVTNNMYMLLSIGFIIISRLSFDKAIRQFFIAIISIIITSFIPYIISKGPFFSKLKWTYAIVGLFTLSFVFMFSVATNGAKISITLFSVTFQPSEFVKLIFIFCIASFLAKAEKFKDIIIVTIIAAAHVLILAISKDLGGAIILFFIYVCVLYVARSNILYLISGLVGGAFASIIGYKLFSHVRIRVKAFTNPFENINDAGFQISQSLFAIGTGGFFGLGIGQGMPKSIPIVAADFVFSAISEEFGTFFGICLILICLSCFVMFMNIAMKFSNLFYKYVAVGIGILYGFQVFLTIGGVTKFIPLTGVTLPLVSYGGTSVLVTVMLFAIIQGLYIGRNHENN